MAISITHLPYGETGYFSSLITDYLNGEAKLRPLYNYSPSAEGIAQAIQDRGKQKIDRAILVSALTEQYKELPKYEKADNNIRSLLNENTYTVCTAHQPNLLTGYLYFIYKILHAIKLAEQLSARHPDKHFVPVYYMGSEDNDIEELGTFRFRGEKYVWDGNGQSGAVGRMSTASLQALLSNLFRLFGPPGSNCDELQAMLTEAYLNHKTIAAATQYLVTELFGRYGLVVLDPDHAALKKTFVPVMEDELLHQQAYPVIAAQTEQLSTHYKIQAHPRLINLFYLSDQVRERIEKKENEWVVVNTNIKWTREGLLSELNEHPERFSPNVMLRGLYQETILPNVAFIGGGAEVAYWMQLKTLFTHYNIFYPAILLRQSVLWIGSLESRSLLRAGISIPLIFKKENELLHDYVVSNTNGQWQTAAETRAIEQIFGTLRQKAIGLDPTLRSSADASLAKMKRQLVILETKMLRAEKKKMQTQLLKITKIKNALFPHNGLQERIENFSEYYLQYGRSYLDILLKYMEPLNSEFLIIANDPG